VKIAAIVCILALLAVLLEFDVQQALVGVTSFVVWDDVSSDF
jgi:hypothetical protein